MKTNLHQKVREGAAREESVSRERNSKANSKAQNGRSIARSKCEETKSMSFNNFTHVHIPYRNIMDSRLFLAISLNLAVQKMHCFESQSQLAGSIRGKTLDDIGITIGYVLMRNEYVRESPLSHGLSHQSCIFKSH